MLILVRHGRTASNATGLLQGRADNPIDEVGVAQIRDVAASIGRVDRVITSSLLRARQTGALFDSDGSEHVADDRWIELDYGDLDGRPLAEIDPETWVRWRADPDFAPSNGESMRAMDRRVRAAATDALESAANTTVLVVSHVSPIKAAVAWALGGDISMTWRMNVAQASVSRISAGPNGPVLISFNEVLYAR